MEYRARGEPAALAAGCRSKIALPKTGRGRYTPSSLVEHQRGPRRQRKRRRISVGTEVRAWKETGAKQQPSSAVCWGLRECQHYPPSWVEAITSLGQVVSGSATPVSASQWNSCRTGSRAFVPGSRGYNRPVRNREQTRAISPGRRANALLSRTGRLLGTPRWVAQSSHSTNSRKFFLPIRPAMSLIVRRSFHGTAS